MMKLYSKIFPLFLLLSVVQLLATASLAGLGDSAEPDHPDEAARIARPQSNPVSELFDPAQIHKVFSTLGALEAFSTHPEVDFPGLQLVALGADLQSPGDVCTQLLKQFIYPDSAPLQVKSAALETQKMARTFFVDSTKQHAARIAPLIGKALGDAGRPIMDQMLHLLYTSPLCNRLRPNLTRTEDVLEEARALAEENTWYFHLLSQYDFNNISDAADKDLQNLWALEGFKPESKIFSAAIVQHVANNLASLWESVLQRMNRYQLPVFDKTELRTKIKKENKDCQFMQSLYKGTRQQALKQHLHIVTLLNKDQHIALEKRATVILNLSLVRLPEPTEFEVGVTRFIKQMMMRHDEDLKALEAILRKSETPTPRVKKQIAPKKKPAAPAPPVVKSEEQKKADKEADEARRHEKAADMAAKEQRRLEAAEGERAKQAEIEAQMVRVRLAKQQLKQEAAAREPMAEMHRAKTALEEQAADPLSDVIFHLKKPTLQSLRDIFSMKPIEFDALLKTLSELGLRVEPASGGVKVWGKLVTGHTQMLHFHRPHHEGNTLHLPSHKALRRMLWNMGLTKDQLG